MRLGVVLPTFRPTAQEAMAAARACEEQGLDGVFAYDHLWPMGQPGRPAIAPFPLLGAVAATTRRVHVGTLVARVGLVPDDVLVRELATLDRVSGGRCIAGIGPGDRKSRAENEAYGVPFPSAEMRRGALESVAHALRGLGVTTWVGGGSTATNAIARRTGAVLNLWGASPERVGELATEGPVTWGGVLPKELGMAARLLAELQAARADWSVFAWPGSLETLLAAAHEAGIAPD